MPPTTAQSQLLPSEFAYGINPKISIRGAWICAGSDDPLRTEAVGTAIAFDFATHRLVCTVRPQLNEWQGLPQGDDPLQAHVPNTRIGR